MKKNKLNYIIPSIIVSFLLIIIMLININLINQNTYYKVGNKRFTLEEYNVFYTVHVNSFLSTYSNYLEDLKLDTNKSFASQNYNEEQSWEDYFKEQTNNDITNFVALNMDMKRNNVNINVDEDVNAMIKVFESNAEYAKLDFDEYIKNLFGNKITKKIL